MPLDTFDIRHVFVTGAVGNRIHGLDFGGGGPPIVCLHGVTGNAWNWHAVAGAVRAHRRVVALDFRGYGESQWSPTHDYTTADHVADLVCAVDAVAGSATADFMGSSWGALVAVQYAAENPDRVGRVVVVDVEPSFDQSETDLFPRARDHTDHADVRTAVARAFPNASTEMVELTSATCFGPVTGGRLAPKHDPFFFERWPFRSDNHWDRLALIQAPTLYVHAAESFVRGEVMAEMDRLTPDSRLVDVAHSTHVVPVDNPEALVEVVVPFLAAD